MWISKRKWEQMEKRIADLEKKSKGQQEELREEIKQKLMRGEKVQIGLNEDAYLSQNQFHVLDDPPKWGKR